MPWTLLLVPFRQNHHPVYSSHGWGRYPWRQSSHHISRETILLRLSCIPKELLWVWLLSHSCSQDEKHQKWKGYSKYAAPFCTCSLKNTCMYSCTAPRQKAVKCCLRLCTKLPSKWRKRWEDLITPHEIIWTWASVKIFPGFINTCSGIQVNIQVDMKP